MSWAEDEEPTLEFAAQADRNMNSTAQLQLEIWQNTPSDPAGSWKPKIGVPSYLANRPTGLRVILAPLDLPQHSTKSVFLTLFKTIGVPASFIRERLQSVSHSFGAVDDSESETHRAWFHFLCKHIELAENAPKVVYQGPSYGPDKTLSAFQADYRWRRFGLFLSVDTSRRTVTLCCFGAWGKVKERLRKFLETTAWKQALDVPYILLDVVLDGLYQEVDDNVWNMNTVFGALEHKRLLVASTSPERASEAKKITFAELHNVAKHITHLREAVESSLLLTESVLHRTQESSRSGGQPGTEKALQELRDMLLYRQSLFRSTKLRLESLNRRVSNSIALSFNLLTVSDSSVLIQHSSVMKIMAAITIIFLPTTAVAAIMGSQLFEASFENESWTVRATPLFALLWAVALPLTFVVLVCASIWHRETHKEDEKNKGLVRRITGL